MRFRITLFILFFSTLAFAQVKPNEFSEETNPTNSNFEVYSQKGGVNRRASLDNLKKYFTPIVFGSVDYVPTPSGNASNRMQFVVDPNGGRWYIDKSGVAIGLANQPVLYSVGISSPLPTQPVPSGSVAIKVYDLNNNKELYFSNGSTWLNAGKLLGIKNVDSLTMLPGAVKAIHLGQNGATDGQVMKWNNSLSKWEPGTISGGSGGDITGFISLGAGTPPAALASSNGGEIWRNNTTGELWRSNGTNWIFVGILDGDRGDITVSSDGNTLTIDNGAVSTAKIASSAIDSSKIAANAVRSSDIGSGQVTMSKIAQAGASSGQVIKWNGSAWVPSSDASAPTGAAGGDLDSNYPNPTVVAIQGHPLSDAIPLPGQALIWDGGSWNPTLPPGAAYEYADGDCLAPTVVPDPVIGPFLAWNTDCLEQWRWTGLEWVLDGSPGGTFITSAQFSGNGESGTPLTLAQNGASTGQVMKWNGTVWGPGVDATGGGGLVPDSTWIGYNNTYSNDINDTIKRNAPASFPVWDKGAVVYNVASFGIFPGGKNGPDLTSKFRALLDTVARRHGGIIQFNQGVYRLDGQVTIPFVKPLTSGNPGAYDRQPAICIRGVGAYKTCWNTNPDSIKGTVLHLNYKDNLANRDTIGKIHTRGAGFLEISDLNLVSDDSTKTAFIIINYTTCHIHNVSFWGSGRAYSNTQAEDAIVCGGDANPQVVNTFNTHFAGYGSVFENCYFYGIRRAWWARAYTNNVVFRDNTIWYQNKGESCIELSTNIPGNVVGGNLISGNTAEVDGYKYFVKLGRSANANTIISNGIYDPTIVTKAFAYIDSSAENNQIFAGYWDTNKFWETNGDRIYVSDRNSIWMNNTSDTTTHGSSLYVAGNVVFRKSLFVREGMVVKYISPYNIRLMPQSLSNYFDFIVDGSNFSISSNEFPGIFKIHKSAPSGIAVDQYGGFLVNRTAFNNDNGAYIHPEGRSIFKQSVYVGYNWDGANTYRLKVNGPSLLNGTLDFSNGCQLLAGTSSPAGSISALAGSLYFRKNNGELWGKKFGSGGTTGWGKYLNTVDTLGAVPNQYLKWNGNAWVPSDVVEALAMVVADPSSNFTSTGVVPNGAWRVPSTFNGWKLEGYTVSLYTAGAGSGSLVIQVQRATPGGSSSSGCSMTFAAGDIQKDVTGCGLTLSTGDMLRLNVGTNDFSTPAQGVVVTYILKP